MSPPEDHSQPVWHYYIDVEGHLWHDGAELDDPPTLQMFMKGMTDLPAEEIRSPEKWRVFCMGEECRIAAEDVPYVVQDVEVSEHKVLLKFPGDYAEPLDPSTLFVGARNVLYAKVRGGKFAARFNRKSYLDLAKHIQYDVRKDVFYLIVDNKRFPIKGASE